MTLQRKAAVHAINNKSEELLKPLLDNESVSSDEDSQYSSSSRASVEVKTTPTQMLRMAAVSLGVSIGAVASVGAMIVSPAIAVFVMGGLCLANAPYSAYKEVKMAKLPTLREMNNKLKEDASNLEDEVNTLTEEIDLLQPETDRVLAVEEELKDIAGRQHTNVNKLVELVKENEAILVQMRDNVRQRISQDIINIVVMSDRDNDQKIDRKEAKMLALRIRLSLQEYGVDFDAAKFRKIVEQHPTIQGVIDIVLKLLPSGNEEEDGDSDNLDEGSGDDLYDMFHLAEPDHTSSLAPEYEAVRRGSRFGSSGMSQENGVTRSISLMNEDKRMGSRRRPRTSGVYGSRTRSSSKPLPEESDSDDY